MNTNYKYKISVCLNTYNHSKYIRDAIEGVLMQKHDYSWQFIIADDFSNDGTSEIIEEYKKLWPELIKLIKRSKNVGAPQNGFELYQAAQSEYIAYIEGDDYWIDEEKLLKQIQFLDTNPNIGLTWTDVDFEYVKNNKIIKSVFNSKKLPIYYTIEEILANKPFFAPSTWVFRRSLSASYKLYDYCDGTFPFIMDVINETELKFIPCVTARYRILEESASNSNSPARRYKFLNGIYEIQKKYAVKYDTTEYIKNEIDFLYNIQALPYAIMIDDRGAVDNIISFLRNHGDKVGIKHKILMHLSKLRFGKYIIYKIYTSNKLRSLVDYIRTLYKRYH